MKLRKVAPEDLRRLQNAIEHLRVTRYLLRLAGAQKAADYVCRALKSTQGAQRHAMRIVDRTACETPA